MIAQLGRYAKSSAFVNVGVGIVSILLLFIFFAIGQPFGTLNDIAVVLWAMALIPTMIGLSLTVQNRTASFALAVGLLGALGVIVFQVLLIVQAMGIWQQQPFLEVSYCLIGVWLLVVSRVDQPAPHTSSRLMWFGLALGALWVVAPFFVWLGGLLPGGSDMASAFSAMSPITYVGFSAFFIAYLLQPFWAFWLARQLS